MTLVAGIAIADSALTLRDIAAQLEQMHEHTPRGGASGSPSSVKALLDRACRLGLLAPDPAPDSRDGRVAGHSLSSSDHRDLGHTAMATWRQISRVAADSQYPAGDPSHPRLPWEPTAGNDGGRYSDKTNRI